MILSSSGINVVYPFGRACSRTFRQLFPDSFLYGFNSREIDVLFLCVRTLPRLLLSLFLATPASSLPLYSPSSLPSTRSSFTPFRTSSNVRSLFHSYPFRSLSFLLSFSLSIPLPLSLCLLFLAHALSFSPLSRILSFSTKKDCKPNTQ